MPDDTPPPHEAETLVEQPVSGVEDTIAPASQPGSSAELLAAAHPQDLHALAPIAHDYYAIGPELARGGMGRIRYGRDLRHGRPVAIKELTLEGDSAARRFAREALITARLQHPSIVPVYEAGTDARGRPFFAMKLVSGRALATILAETQTFSDRMALLPTVVGVADAIAYAHSKRVVHRDLKPGNVLVGRFGETVVIDWGLAKDLTDDDGDDSLPPAASATLERGLTVAGTAMGTPGYMPPEQAFGRAVDERADVYALGATLYHVLGGLAPYADCASARDLMAVLGEAPPTALGEVEPRVPAELQTIVAKAMARNPEDRYANAQELAEELRQYRTGNLVEAYHYSRLELFARWVGRHKAALLAVTLVIAVAAVTAAYFLRREQSLRGTTQTVEELAGAQRVELLQHKGHVELAAGRPLPALAYLGEAYWLGADGVALRAMLAEASRSLDAVVATIEQQGAVVYAAELSPDGEHVLTATEHGAFLRTANGGDTARLLVQGSRVWSASFSGDGQRFVITPWDRPAEVWDKTTLETVANLAEPVEWAAMSHDGTRVITRKNATVAIWRADDGALRATIRHDEPVRTAALSRDGRFAVTVAEDGVARVWQTDDGTARSAFGVDVVAAAPSPDAALVATAHEDGTAGLWNTRSGSRLGVLRGHRRALTGAAFDADGARLVTTSQDGTARVWSVRDQSLVAELRGHRASVTDARFSPDGTRIVTTSRDWTARVWNARTGKPLMALEYGADVDTASFSPDGMRVIAAGERGAYAWTLASGQLIARIQGHVAGLDLAVFSPDESRIATAGRDGTATLFDADAGGRLGALAHGAALTSMQFSGDGKRLLSASRDGTAKLWEADSGLRIATVDHGGHVLAAGFRGADAIVTANDAGSVKAWNADTGEPTQELATIAGDLACAAFDPAGAAVATVVADARTVEVRRLDASAKVVALEGHRDAVVGVAFSPDGSRLVTASLDSTARVWDARGGALVALLVGHAGAVSYASFDTAGARVVTASDDGTARVWDAASGALIATLEGHERPLTYAAFDPDGDRVITASDDGAAILWDTHLDERSRRDVRKLIERHVPWRVDGTTLVPAR